ncbi:protein ACCUMULATION AND REPLICATION OF CHLOROPLASTS 3, chloroplastic [Aristolochia californica]|uniref:protein ACCUMULATION AND REPLICATION OF CHLOROPLASTS 3, chloroplastic n=1 Tax=Aristolochia californica TaxID=171875 RepID=UPI0035DCD412
MELLFPTTSLKNLAVESTVSVVKFPPHSCFYRHKKFRWRSRRWSIVLRVSSKRDYVSADARKSCLEPEQHAASSEDPETVDVIVIGSRKDAIIDFCLDSSFASSLFKFWTVYAKDPQKMQLLLRSTGKDTVLRNVEALLSTQSFARAIILVASAGYGSDQVTVAKLLSTVKSRDGLAIAIILRPFSFEGQRRQNEVEELVKSLRECTTFCIDVDTDALLKKEVVTLAEALRSANNAVLLAINAIYVLSSDKHLKLCDSPHDKLEEFKVPQVLKCLEDYKQAEIGFGAGYNIKSSISRAVFDCPFLSSGLKGLSGIVICIVASASEMNRSDLNTFVHTFRKTAQCATEIVVSAIHEPNLEKDMVVTTLLVMGCSEQKSSQKKTLLSSLVQHFPFFFSLFGGNHSRLEDRILAPSEQILGPPESVKVEDSNIINGEDANIDLHSEELEMLPDDSDDSDDINTRFDDEDLGSRFSISNDTPISVSPGIALSNEGEPAFQREPPASWSFGPGFHIAQKWTQTRASSFESTAKVDKLNVYPLPVGVKPSEHSADILLSVNSTRVTDTKVSNDLSAESLDVPNGPSWDALTDSSMEAVADIYNAAAVLIKGKPVDLSKKQGLLSARAASMLEVERDSHKNWNPVMEMQYRGGMYKGRCQGGLPEGKGRLTLNDGSFYYGMWRYGKRSGLGTFYYSNGDVFQGSWRDDLIHGKGWFYFHTGDRWFANFWKGKANGEGRFYLKSGSIFFGNFREGWRHGKSLCIDSDGTRWIEFWEEGVLVSRDKLDSESSTE